MKYINESLLHKPLIGGNCVTEFNGGNKKFKMCVPENETMLLYILSSGVNLIESCLCLHFQH